jgi:hypothetical protein
MFNESVRINSRLEKHGDHGYDTVLDRATENRLCEGIYRWRLDVKDSATELEIVADLEPLEYLISYDLVAWFVQ